MTDFSERLAFLAATDGLKHVTRANRIVDGSRQENVAEHTWHVTLMTLLFADAAPQGTNLDHVRALLIAHDLVEIHAGDTVIWDNVSAADVAAREAAAARQLFRLLPEPQRGEFTALAEEFAAQCTIEARFARALDALHPMVMSWGPDGIGHPRLDLKPAVVLARKHRDIGAFPQLWEIAEWLVASAVERNLMPADDEA